MLLSGYVTTHRDHIIMLKRSPVCSFIQPFALLLAQHHLIESVCFTSRIGLDGYHWEGTRTRKEFSAFNMFARTYLL